MRGDSEPVGWPFYDLSRAVCAIELDPNFAAGKPSDAASRKAIVQDLRVARRGLSGFGEMLEQPHHVNVRKWLEVNGSPRLD